MPTFTFTFGTVSLVHILISPIISERRRGNDCRSRNDLLQGTDHKHSLRKTNARTKKKKKGMLTNLFLPDWLCQYREENESPEED